jgi:aldose 1-epimerase
VAWTVVDQHDSGVRLATAIYPQPGYPFALQLEVAYELGDAGLVVETTARNAGSRRLPFGTGHHPYLSPGAGLVDAIDLTLPAATVLSVNQRGIPTGRLPVAGTELDFRQSRQIGERRLDHCWTDLQTGPDGLARVRFGGIELWLDPSYRYVMIYSGDTLPDPAHRRRGLAVEPMTCPPNAFRSGEDVIVLEPGEECRQAWGVGLK